MGNMEPRFPKNEFLSIDVGPIPGNLSENPTVTKKCTPGCAINHTFQVMWEIHTHFAVQFNIP